MSDKKHYTRIAIDHAQGAEVSVNVIVEDKARFFRIFNAVLDHGIFAELSNRAARTYIGLARHASNEWECYPSVARLAVLAGVSRSSIFRGLKELEDKGLLLRLSGRGKGASLYKLLPPPMETNVSKLTPLASDLTPPNVSAEHPKCVRAKTHRTTKRTNLDKNNNNDDCVAVSSLLQTHEGYDQVLADKLAETTTLDELRGCQLLCDKSNPRNRGGFLRRCLEEKWDTKYLLEKQQTKTHQRNLFEDAALAEVDREKEIESQRLAEENTIAKFATVEIEDAIRIIKESLPKAEAMFLEGKTVHNSLTLHSKVAAFLSSK